MDADHSIVDVVIVGGGGVVFRTRYVHSVNCSIPVNNAQKPKNQRIVFVWTINGPSTKKKREKRIRDVGHSRLGNLDKFQSDILQCFKRPINFQPTYDAYAIKNVNWIIKMSVSILVWPIFLVITGTFVSQKSFRKIQKIFRTVVPCYFSSMQKFQLRRPVESNLYYLYTRQYEY